MWNFLCSNNTIVSFSSQSTIIYLVITLGFGRLSLTAGGSFRGVCRQGFSATCPAAWMLADESRSIFQSIKPESLDAAQENNIAKSYWWLSESQPPRLPYNVRMWNHLKKTVGNSLWCLSINNTWLNIPPPPPSWHNTNISLYRPCLEPIVLKDSFFILHILIYLNTEKLSFWKQSLTDLMEAETHLFRVTLRRINFKLPTANRSDSY